jgi:acetyl-CoA C-acetyltransferase
VNQALDLDPAKVNPKGGAIALCHPIGRTGCILLGNAFYELRRIGKRYALVMMCIGGGQGIAMIIERL